MFLEHTVVVTCLYMAWIIDRDRQLIVIHGNVMRNGVTFWLHCVLLWAHLSQVWSGGGASEMKGGVSCEVAVVNSIDWHCVQHLTVLCFRVLSVVIFGYFCFHIFLVHEAYILMLAMLCPIKKSECLMKDLRSLQKWRRILEKQIDI